jgi:hypothetical protein
MADLIGKDRLEDMEFDRAWWRIKIRGKRADGDIKDWSKYNKKLGITEWEKKKEMGNGLGSFIISRENFWITAFWWRKAINGECRLANFDELLSFGKERQKAKTRVFSSVSQREVLGLLFINGSATNKRSWQWPSSILHMARFQGLGWIGSNMGWIRYKRKRKKDSIF